MAKSLALPPPRKFLSGVHVLEPKTWDSLRLHGLLQSFVGKRILVVGDVGVDRYTVGTVDRISPEAPVPIVAVEREEHKLGLAANVGDNIRALKAEAELIGVVGEDRAAQDFRTLLKKAGIGGARLVADPARRTVLKERIVTDRQQLLRIDYETAEAISPQTERKIIDQLSKAVEKVDGVIVEDYAKGVFNERVCQAVIRAARRAKKLVTVDPNSKTDVSFYRGADLIKPNRQEAERLSGIKIKDDATALASAREILGRTKARWVVITLGRDGIVILERRAKGLVRIPTFVREVYDVSGAGDTVIAVLTLALTSGANVDEAAILANLAAGVEVGKRGTATVTAEEITQALEQARLA